MRPAITLACLLAVGLSLASSRLHTRDFVVQIGPSMSSTDADLPRLAGAVRRVAAEFELKESDESLSWQGSVDPVVNVDIDRIRDERVVTVWQLSSERRPTIQYRGVRRRLSEVLRAEFRGRVVGRKGTGPMGKP